MDELRSVFEAAIEASKHCGDAKKRKLIQNALRNAFDEEAYEAGMTLNMFRSLENLHYPEIHFLREAATEAPWK